MDGDGWETDLLWSFCSVYTYQIIKLYAWNHNNDMSEIDLNKINDYSRLLSLIPSVEGLYRKKRPSKRKPLPVSELRHEFSPNL